MARQQLLSAATRVFARSSALVPIRRIPSLTTQRYISSSQVHKNKDDSYHESSTATLGKPGFDHEGSSSRTDKNIVVEYPEAAGQMPAESTIQGRGGPHLKRTLAQFSLEGRVAIVTGGARGLGLVMAQSLVESGADVAIVDLNGIILSPAIAAQTNILI